MKRPMIRHVAAAALLVVMTTGPVSAGERPFPDRIDLPDNFAPEGIATGTGPTFYTGSLSGAGIWRGDYRAGTGSLLVVGGGPFTGMKVDARGTLWVAGGPSGLGYRFDATTGALLQTFSFASAATFVNDVVVTVDAAYFTDSFRGVVYRVDAADFSISEIDLTAVAPPAVNVFRLNGIDATADGKTLIVVDSTAGALYTIDVATERISPVTISGGSVAAGDGILLQGRTLYVIRNQVGRLAIVELSPDLASGVVEERVLEGVDVPTTVARFGSSLYVVNARFRPMGTPPPEDFWVTRVDR